MDTELDVLVTVRDIKAFGGLLASLDSQTLPARAFRVVAAPEGLDPSARDLLDRLAAHRPNVVVGDEPSAPVGLVLPLSDQERLTAGALERLLATAQSTGAEVVVGKAVAPTTDWTVFDADRVVPASALAGVDVSSLPVVMPGGTTPLADVAAARRAAVDAAQDVAVLASRVVLAAPGSEQASVAPPRRVVDVEWRDGVLEVRDTAGGVVRAVLRSLASGAEWAVPADEAGHLVRIDPRTAALGRPLAKERWVVDLHLADRVVAAAPSDALPCAFLELTPGHPAVVVLRRAEGQLLLDLALDQGLPRRVFRPGTARIAESARGTLLEWPLRIHDFTSTGQIQVGLRIGSLPFRAELVHGDGEPVLRAWLSGLPGVEPLSVQVRGKRWHRTGAELVIANAGSMSLRRDTSQQTKKAAAPSTGATATATPPALGLRVRRAVGSIPVVGDAARAAARRLRSS
jgi:hypothetical protein